MFFEVERKRMVCGSHKSDQEHKTLDQILCRKTAEFGPKKFDGQLGPVGGEGEMWIKMFWKKGKALKSFDFKAFVVAGGGFEPPTSGL